MELYEQIYSMKNLILAYKRARKGKTKKVYVKEFEKNIAYNLKTLHDEIKNQIYRPKPLTLFIVRDPKTRKVSKAEFRDRVVHHSIINILEPIFDPIFIYDSCANRKKKGNLFGIKRLEKFTRKVTNNLKTEAFYFKADIKHYFQEVDHNILLKIIKRKIKEEKVIWLIEQVLASRERERREQTSYYQKRNAFGKFNFPIFCEYIST